MENTVVRVFFLEVRARSPNTVAAAPAPTPMQNHTLSSSNTRCEIMALVGYAISLIRAGQTAEALHHLYVLCSVIYHKIKEIGQLKT